MLKYIISGCLTLFVSALFYYNFDTSTNVSLEKIGLESEEEHRPRPRGGVKAGTSNKISYSTGDKVSYSIPNPNNKGSWESIGPFGNPDVRFNATGNGATDHIAFHPTNRLIMYLSVRNGGLFRTTDGGHHWEPFSDYFCNGAYVSAVSQSNPKILYIGGEEANIWYTNDEGASWELRDAGIQGRPYDIHIHPSDPTRVLASTDQGVYLSTDAGLSWTRKLSSGSYSDIFITEDWSYLATTTNKVATSPSYKYSTDAGDSWQERLITNNINSVNRVYVQLHQSLDGSGLKIFAMLISNKPWDGPTRFSGLYRSDDMGASFTEIKHPNYSYPNGPVMLKVTQGTLTETVAKYGEAAPSNNGAWVGGFYVSPNNPNHMITMAEKTWGSEDGGLTWSQRISYGDVGWADRRYINHTPAKDTVYWNDDGGVWAIAFEDLFPYSDKAKVVEKNGDLAISEGSTFDVSAQTRGVFITGGQDIGQVFVRNGRRSHIGASDSYVGRICPHDDSRFIISGINAHVKKYNTSYHIYNSIKTNHFDSKQIYGFSNGKNHPVELLRSPAGKDGWDISNPKSENNFSWTTTSNSSVSDWEVVVDKAVLGISQLKAHTFEQSRANADLAFLGDEIGKRLFMTTNLSNSNPTWIELTNAPELTKYRIATFSGDENLIALAITNKVYISRDKGATWNTYGNFQGNSPLQLLYDEGPEEGLYVLTSTTIFYKDKNLPDWIEFNKGLPHKHNMEMKLVHYTGGDSRIFIGKYGRGVWESPTFAGTLVDCNQTENGTAYIDYCDDCVGGTTGEQPCQVAYNQHAIPGTVEMEAYDHGGQNISYYDETEVNSGGSLRLTEPVDIGEISAGAYFLGWTAKNEWLEYTVEVDESGLYDIECIVASITSTGYFHLEVDDVSIVSSINVMATGSWATYETQTISEVQLEEGTHVLKVVIDEGGLNIDKLVFKPSVISATLNEFNTQVSLYPNPVQNNKFRVEVPQETLVMVYDSKGVLMYKNHVTNEQLVSTTGWSEGIYLVELVSDEHKITRTIVVE